MLQVITNHYNDLLHNKSDPRVEELFLMKSVFPTLALCVSYLFIIYFLGPKFMKNRKPYGLQNVLIVYNIFQVLLSAYIFYENLAIGWLTKFSIFKCQSVDYTENPQSQREIMAIYIYFLSKFTEFLDTIFFVLRKKESQISFLHVYHHVSMPLYIWTVTKFYPGGSLTFIPFINSIIHVIMYVYYLLAGLGPQMQKYLWWKKYLTALQLIQFVTGTGHFIIVLLSNRSTCNISKRLIAAYIAIGCFFFMLFNNFYNRVYVQKTPNVNEQSSKVENRFKNEEIKKKN